MGPCGSCAGHVVGHGKAPGPGEVHTCAYALIIPTLAVPWLCCFSLLAAKQRGSDELPGLIGEGREKIRNEE